MGPNGSRYWFPDMGTETQTDLAENNTDRDFLTTGDVAHRLHVSADSVRGWTRRGWLLPTRRTVGGMRLYDPDVVRQFDIWRSERRRPVTKHERGPPI